MKGIGDVIFATFLINSFRHCKRSTLQTDARPKIKKRFDTFFFEWIERQTHGCNTLF